MNSYNNCKKSLHSFGSDYDIDKEQLQQKRRVEHPSHYTSHPSGIECIDITRHYCFDIGNAIKYLWRSGLKYEEGISDIDKEIEDLNKAIWYINDHINQLKNKNHDIPN